MVQVKVCLKKKKNQLQRVKHVDPFKIDFSDFVLILMDILFKLVLSNSFINYYYYYLKEDKINKFYGA